MSRITSVAVAAVIAASLSTPAAASTAVAHGGVNSNGSQSAAEIGPAAEHFTWTWIEDTKPKVASYTPDAHHQLNSYSQPGQIVRTSKGKWVVTYMGFTSRNGPVHVTSLAPQGLAMCAVHQLRNTTVDGGVSGPKPKTEIKVSCFDRNDFAIDTGWVLNFFSNYSPNSHPVAYELEESFIQTGSDTPPAKDQWNYNGYTNHIDHLTGVGQYDAVFPDVSFSGGNVQVTAYGSKSVCDIDHWYTAAPQFQVHSLHVVIQCRTGDGTPDDTGFAVTYTSQAGLKGVEFPDQAYLFADQPTAASYTPNTGNQWSTSGQNAKVKRSSVGHYTATFPGIYSAGSAQVTAYGGQGTGATLDRRCVVTSLTTTSGTVPKAEPLKKAKVQVECFNASGKPKDSEFTLSFAR